MILVIVDHHCRPGMTAQAEKRLDANGDRMETAAGFLFRYRLASKDDPLKLSTVTAWRDELSYEAYLTARRAIDPGPLFKGETPYARTDTEIHPVMRAQGQGPS